MTETSVIAASEDPADDRGFCPSCGEKLTESFYEHTTVFHSQNGEIIILNNPLYELDSIPLGAGVFVRYLDHVFFKNVESEAEQLPREMNAAGLLDYQDERAVRLKWEHYDQPNESGTSRTRSTGITILKSTILEVRKLS